MAETLYLKQMECGPMQNYVYLIGACGRVDLPNSSPEDMYDSLTNRLMRLDDATVLYPGHNYARTPTSTIGEERRHNPYVQFTSLHAFLRAMGH